MPRLSNEAYVDVAIAKAQAAAKFGDARAVEVWDLAVRVAKMESLSVLHSMQVLMQVEDEFRNRVQEFVDRAKEASDEYGTPFLFCMIQLIKIERLKAAGKSTDYDAHGSKPEL